MTALMIAVFKKDFSTFNLLIEKKANLDLQNHQGLTALLIAVDQNLPEFIKTLIEKKLIEKRVPAIKNRVRPKNVRKCTFCIRQ